MEGWSRGWVVVAAGQWKTTGSTWWHSLQSWWETIQMCGCRRKGRWATHFEPQELGPPATGQGCPKRADCWFCKDSLRLPPHYALSPGFSILQDARPSFKAHIIGFFLHAGSWLEVLCPTLSAGKLGSLGGAGETNKQTKKQLEPLSRIDFWVNGSYFTWE